MQLHLNDIQRSANRAANRAWKNTKNYITPVAREAYSQGQDVSEQIRRAYPALIDNVTDAANKALRQSKQALHTAGGQVSVAANTLGRKAHGVESSLLKISFVYAVYRLFVSDDQVVQVANRTKVRIEARPIESAAIAVGVGYLLGKFIRW